MSYLCFGHHCPFAVVTTATRRGHRSRSLYAQIDLKGTDGSLQLRFTDPASLAVLRNAVCRLLADIQDDTVPPGHHIRTRVFSPNEPYGASPF